MYDTLIKRPLTKSRNRCERCYRHMLGDINVFFNIDLKRSSDSFGIQMPSGSEFQTTGPETRKPLGPKRRVLVWGTVRSPRIADRRWALAPTSRTGLQVQLGYVEPRPGRSMLTKTAILTSIRWRMGSQWSWSLSTGVIWLNSLWFKISLAAASRTDCSLLTTMFVAPWKYCCSNRHDLIWENIPMFSRYPLRVIVGCISAVSTAWLDRLDRNSFEWCCLHAGPFPVHYQMSRRESWRR